MSRLPFIRESDRACDQYRIITVEPPLATSSVRKRPPNRNPDQRWSLMGGSIAYLLFRQLNQDIDRPGTPWKPLTLTVGRSWLSRRKLTRKYGKVNDDNTNVLEQHEVSTPFLAGQKSKVLLTRAEFL